MVSPRYFNISSAVAIGALVHGLNLNPKVYKSLSDLIPGYLWVYQVPP